MPPQRTHTPIQKASDSSQVDSEATGASIPNKLVKRPRSSLIWKYGTEIEGTYGSYWRCSRCSGAPKTFSDASTSHAAKHLRDVHKISESGNISTNQATLMLSSPKIDAKVARKLIVQWIIDRRHSFIEIEAPSFHKLIEYLNPATINTIPKTGDTLRMDTIKYFDTTKAILIEQLSSTRSKIHFSFDLWTSPNYQAILAVIGHWTSSNYMVQSALLAMRQVEGGHTGENIAGIVHNIITDYAITHKLSYFMADNATNNDKALCILEHRIREEGGVGFDVNERRLRCFGHILNLGVKTLLLAQMWQH
jgi:hypothetical protein